MGVLVLNSDSLIFSAFLLFLGGWFALDAVRYVVWGLRNKTSPRGSPVDVGPACSRQCRRGDLYPFAVSAGRRRGSSRSVGALRIFGTAWNVLAAAVYTEEDSSRTTVEDLGLGDDPRLVALGERIQAEESARGPRRLRLDRGDSSRRSLRSTWHGWAWIARSSASSRRPFAVLGDLLMALVAAFGVIIPLRLLWRRRRAGSSASSWRWSVTDPAGRLGNWVRSVLERWLSSRPPLLDPAPSCQLLAARGHEPGSSDRTAHRGDHGRRVPRSGDELVL